MIAIVKYNAGNIRSVKNAIDRLGYENTVTDDVEILQNADKVIFPGVGEASTAMKYLRSSHLDMVIRNLKQPVLGICLGMQLMCRHSEENNTECLNIFEVDVKKFPPEDNIPHMGWNAIYQLNGALYKNLQEGADVYFVHSYYAGLNEHTAATCNYILEFSAAMQKDNFYATQFHPEKSSSMGEQILQKFLEL